MRCVYVPALQVQGLKPGAFKLWVNWIQLVQPRRGVEDVGEAQELREKICVFTEEKDALETELAETNDSLREGKADKARVQTELEAAEQERRLGGSVRCVEKNRYSQHRRQTTQAGNAQRVESTGPLAAGQRTGSRTKGHRGSGATGHAPTATCNRRRATEHMRRW